LSQNGQVVAAVGMKDKKAVSLLILFSYSFFVEVGNENRRTDTK